MMSVLIVLSHDSLEMVAVGDDCTWNAKGIGRTRQKMAGIFRCSFYEATKPTEM